MSNSKISDGTQRKLFAAGLASTNPDPVEFWRERRTADLLWVAVLSGISGWIMGVVSVWVFFL